VTLVFPVLAAVTFISLFRKQAEQKKKKKAQ
jgi:hypothetical protein